MLKLYFVLILILSLGALSNPAIAEQDWNNMGYYELLGVPKQTTQEEIKMGYRRQVSQYHPDRTGNSAEATQRLRKARVAYKTLKRSSKQKQV